MGGEVRGLKVARCQTDALNRKFASAMITDTCKMVN